MKKDNPFQCLCVSEHYTRSACKDSRSDVRRAEEKQRNTHPTPPPRFTDVCLYETLECLVRGSAEHAHFAAEVLVHVLVQLLAAARQQAQGCQQPFQQKHSTVSPPTFESQQKNNVVSHLLDSNSNTQNQKRQEKILRGQGNLGLDVWNRETLQMARIFQRDKRKTVFTLARVKTSRKSRNRVTSPWTIGEKREYARRDEKLQS